MIPPDWLLQMVARYLDGSGGYSVAQILWQRGHRDPEQIAGFLDPSCYQPTSPSAFGQELFLAVQRIQHAIEHQQQVVIWGDFDADGITATAVLWDGLSVWLEQHAQLHYVIPDRLKDSHGLSKAGLESLAAKGCQLVITCDTGSGNSDEVAYAQQLGIDVIVTDHHTLPQERPPAVAILNPRYLPASHPLAHLSGVGVAYKLMEALYQYLPTYLPNHLPNQSQDSDPQRSLARLLDLVAIGLIADLVQLVGDCRYLAQVGIAQLQVTSRPGITHLLALCKRAGDRPTDISFGLGPRINAISRIYGDASRCVELLTSQDPDRCQQLAEEAELANTRRKALQRDVAYQVRQRLTQLDLSTTGVIVLADPQWPVGILGLVAAEIARDYNRPTILLQTDVAAEPDLWGSPNPSIDPSLYHLPLARGSARSVNNIDLYSLVQSQAYLLHRFGGHPFAAGLSLPVANLPLFIDAINHQFRHQVGEVPACLPPQAELTVTVAELGQGLFRELKLLEPCGMGNPVPHLLIRHCWFTDPWHENINDRRGHKVPYIKTTCKLWDHTVDKGFPGVWWGHYKTELPVGICDAIVELDVHQSNYVARIIAVIPATPASAVPMSMPTSPISLPYNVPDILDWRKQPQQGTPDTPILQSPCPSPQPIVLQTCPYTWEELRYWWKQAVTARSPLALAYGLPAQRSPRETLQALLRLACQLSHRGHSLTLRDFAQQLGVSNRTMTLALNLLTQIGFCITWNAEQQQITLTLATTITRDHLDTIARRVSPVQFLMAVQADQFQQQYFVHVPLTTLRSVLEGETTDATLMAEATIW